MLNELWALSMWWLWSNLFKTCCIIVMSFPKYTSKAPTTIQTTLLKHRCPIKVSNQIKPVYIRGGEREEKGRNQILEGSHIMLRCGLAPDQMLQKAYLHLTCCMSPSAWLLVCNSWILKLPRSLPPSVIKLQAWLLRWSTTSIHALMGSQLSRMCKIVRLPYPHGERERSHTSLPLIHPTLKTLAKLCTLKQCSGRTGD